MVPELHAFTVNQGLGSYSALVRGKETLVRFYLSLPACAGTTASISIGSGSLTARSGGSTLASVSAYSPAPASTAPKVVSYSSAPAMDSPADPIFVLPGAALVNPATTGRYTMSLAATINYTAKASSSASPVSRSITYATTTVPDPTTGVTKALEATVERRTNALRILVVPMGDSRKTYASQFDTAAQSATQNGMTTLSRLLPVPAGTGDLTGTSGGVRYTIVPTLVDVSAQFNTSGRFCGTDANMSAIEAELAQYLQSWNTANPNTPVDRVMGVVAAGISDGANGSCADGMARQGGAYVWVRAIPDAVNAPSPTGSLMAMEIGHSLGLVPSSRAARADGVHSPNTVADLTAPNRAYNVTLRRFLAEDRTVMRLGDYASWHNNTTLFERDDWAYLVCSLGGLLAAECAVSGSVGTATGVGAAPTFVITGTTDGTPAGTRVVMSYFAPGVALTNPAPESSYRLVQRAGTRTVRDDGVAVSLTHSAHDGTEPEDGLAPTGLFSTAVPFATGADTIELWRGTPGAAGAALLYVRSQGSRPVLTGFTTAPGGRAVTERVSVASDGAEAIGPVGPGSVGSESPSITADGRFVGFNSDATNLVAADTNDDRDVFLHDRQTGLTEHVSTATDGTHGNGRSGTPSVSRDGRFVGFTSEATNLVAGDTNGLPDVFVRDRQTGVTERVSVATDGTQANFPARLPSVSADGRYVAFVSRASTLVPGDTNNFANDVFLHDRQTRTTARVSVGTGGTEGNDAIPSVVPLLPIDSGSFSPSVSADGRFVSFASASSNLVPGDTNEAYDVFVHDRATVTTERVSVDSAGTQADLGVYQGATAISGDGRYVSFTSEASNLVAGDTNGLHDVFVRDRMAGTTERVSVTSSGLQGNGTALGLRHGMTPDGRFVVFRATSSLVPGDTNGAYDVFVRDRLTGTTERVSVGSGEVEGNGESIEASLAADGRTVAFMSRATNLVAGDSNGSPDVFVRERAVAVTATAADDTPSHLRLELRYACDGVTYPVAVGVPPEEVTGTAATFEANFDPALACADGTLSAVVSDGFSLSAPSAPTPVGTPPQAPVGAVYGPPPGTTYTQYDSLPLVGSGRDPEDGELAGGSLSWSLTPPGGPPSPSGIGSKVDLAPPSSGWPPGEYTLTLTVTDSDQQSHTTTSIVHVLADADNDGIAAPTEALPCFPPGADGDAANAYGDADGDGLANADDPDPCTPASSYEAQAVFNPDPFYLPSAGNTVTVEVRLPARDLRRVSGSSVRIVRIAGSDVSATPGFPATAWSATSRVGIAKFDRQRLLAYLADNDLVDRRVRIDVAGREGSGAWDFRGTTSTHVIRQE